MWWNTLHQGPTVTKLDKPSISLEMLLPLLGMAIGFMLYFGAVLMTRVRSEVLARERSSKWVEQMIASR
jgi:heme exporter protein C